jgi:hypothetical protein
MLFSTTLPDGSTDGGVGVVFVAGVAIIGGGIILMVIYSLINPGFFKGKEIEVGSVRQETDMTPFDAAADHASAEREEHLQHETGR